MKGGTLLPPSFCVFLKGKFSICTTNLSQIYKLLESAQNCISQLLSYCPGEKQGGEGIGNVESQPATLGNRWS